jgi:hypothetical protein
VIFHTDLAELLGCLQEREREKERERETESEKETRDEKERKRYISSIYIFDPSL